mmetsp:Transcript_5654/g.10214  ORF Transcript_5654/g.10214 Transcript_5654/m.10214 type:complete len:176 (+) Transcript_5654:334-861(+)
MNMCVVVGPSDAACIRREYLLDNDAYIVHSLKKMHVQISSGRWASFQRDILYLEKYRDNILAWMEINSNWRGRYTAENMKKYKDGPLLVEADLVFNNPAVATEIGLLEVLRFLVEEKHINVNRSDWAAFATLGGGNQHLYELALLRGDIALLQYVLSVDTLDLAKSIASDGLCFE